LAVSATKILLEKSAPGGPQSDLSREHLGRGTNPITTG
jgi:hypothetical protein